MRGVEGLFNYVLEWNGRDKDILLAVSFRPNQRVCVIVRLKRDWELPLGARRRARPELVMMRADMVMWAAVKVVRGN